MYGTWKLGEDEDHINTLAALRRLPGLHSSLHCHGSQGAPVLCFLLPPQAVDVGCGNQVGVVAGSGGEESESNPPEWSWPDAANGVTETWLS